MPFVHVYMLAHVLDDCNLFDTQVLLDACLAMYDRWEFEPQATQIASFSGPATQLTESAPAASPATAAGTTEPATSTPAATAVTTTSAPALQREFRAYVVYAAVFLGSAARQALLERYPVVHEHVLADHLTLCYRPSASVVATLPIGARVSLHILAEHRDEHAQAVEVALAPSEHSLASANAWYSCSLKV